ncbi:MAG TPA: YfhO family protein [Ignavibacteriaceae bacterium]|nr:YfhO family protein [Ignavibacteriaceae bacterium]
MNLEEKILVIKDFFQKHEFISVLILLAGILVIFFPGIIFFNHTFSNSALVPGTLPSGVYGYTYDKGEYAIRPSFSSADSSWQYEPWLFYAAEQIQELHLPLWNPYIGVGMPFAANMMSGIYYPLNFLVFIGNHSSFLFLIDLTILLKLYIAGFFTYCFMRELAINKPASLFSSISFMFCGYFLVYITMAHLNVEILIPAVFFCFERIIKKPDFYNSIIASFFVFLSIIGGMPESTALLFFFVGLYILVRIFQDSKNNHKIEDIISKIFWLGLAFVVGILLSAFLLIPFIEFVSSAAVPSHPIDGFIGLYHKSFNFDTISIIIPHFFGYFGNIWYHSDLYGNPITFIGIITVFFALCAIRLKDIKSTISIFFSIFAIFYILKNYGVFFVNWIGYLPLFNLIVFPKYLTPEFSFCMAVLGGIGLQNIFNLSKKRVTITFVTIITIIGLFMLFNLPAAATTGWIITISGIKFSALYWIIMMVAASLFWLTIIGVWYNYGIKKDHFNQYLLFSLMVIILVIELFLCTSISYVDRYPPYTAPPYINYLKSDAGEFRVLGTDYVLYPNIASVYGISDIRDYDAMFVNRYYQFYNKLLENADKKLTLSEYKTPPQSVYPSIIQINPNNLKFLSLLNVKYILANSDLIKQKNLSDSNIVLIYNKEVKIYENKKVIPRVFFVNQAIVLSTEDSIIKELNNSSFDPRKTLIIEKNIPELTQIKEINNNTVNNSYFTNICLYEPNLVNITIITDNPGFLVLTDTFYPGWNVYVDGKIREILPSDYLFRGVFIEKGTHQVEFKYEPLSFRLGLVISVLTGIVIILIFILLIRRKYTIQ